jgi:hypothetical protein
MKILKFRELLLTRPVLIILLNLILTPQTDYIIPITTLQLVEAGLCLQRCYGIIPEVKGYATEMNLHGA